MKCLVFSDSHGSSYYIRRALSLNRDAEAVFFLGDGISDIFDLREEYQNIAFFMVKGNCDIGISSICTDVKNTDKIELLGKKIVFTHGNLFGVKYGYDKIRYLANEECADIVLFGHTHIPECKYITEENQKPYYLFNPGSIGSFPASFGIMTISEKDILFSHGKIT